MALINHVKREINAKIVYYGCEGAGKSTSLRYIYDRIKPSLRGELKNLPIGGGSLLFFDFSPFEALVFGGYRVRFHIYTLPGRVINPAAWKMTLKGADGVVVVADASPAKLSAGVAGVQNLRDFLAAYGLGMHDVATVLQLNRFGNSMTITSDEASAALDLTGMTACLSEAASGDGVLETLTTLSRTVMKRIGEDEAFATSGTGQLLEGDRPAEAIIGDESSEYDETDVPETASGQIVVAEQQDNLPECRDLRNQIRVGLAGNGATCHDGIVRIPLELTLGGETRRLVVSVAIEEV
jgi:signal recognition particle receptor subunit beta